MAKTKISEFSTTANNNSDINSINISEGCAPSGINDAIRELMRQLKEFQTGGAGDSVNSGGDFSVATNKFTVASASGNTSVAGTLGVTGAATLSSTLAVTGTTTLTGALVANGNATLGDASGDTVTIKGTPTLEVNPTLSGGTANGVLYLNGSKVATSGSALTFDGTTLGNSGGFLTLARPSGIGNTQITLTNNGAGASGFQLGQSAQQQQFFIYDTGAAKDRYIINSSGEHAWYGASEAMRLTSTGLGIGTSSPSSKLVVSNAGAAGFEVNPIGSASAPAIYSYNRNTSAYGILTSISSEARWQTGSSPAETMRLDSSGNLGLGVTPSAWWSSFKAFQFGNVGSVYSGSGVTTVGHNTYYDGSNSRYLTTDSASFYTQTAGQHQWYTAASGTAGNAISFTQAMTLTAGGNLLVGTTSANANLANGIQVASTNWGSAITVTAGAAAGTCAAWGRTNDGNVGQFYHDTSFTTLVGSISVTATATAYNTSSDYRLKNIDGPLTDSGAFIDALKPKVGTWKADGSKFVGFIAHEVQEVSPGSVVGEKDGEQMQAMEYGSAEFIANIIAELQSLRARVAALES